MQPNRIDRFFRRNLSKMDVAPPDDLWANIAGAVQAENERARPRTLLKGLGIFALITGMVSVMYMQPGADSIAHYRAASPIEKIASDHTAVAVMPTEIGSGLVNPSAETLAWNELQASRANNGTAANLLAGNSAEGLAASASTGMETGEAEGIRGADASNMMAHAEAGELGKIELPRETVMNDHFMGHPWLCHNVNPVITPRDWSNSGLIFRRMVVDQSSNPSLVRPAGKFASAYANVGMSDIGGQFGSVLSQQSGLSVAVPQTRLALGVNSITQLSSTSTNHSTQLAASLDLAKFGSGWLSAGASVMYNTIDYDASSLLFSGQNGAGVVDPLANAEKRKSKTTRYGVSYNSKNVQMSLSTQNLGNQIAHKSENNVKATQQQVPTGPNALDASYITLDVMVRVPLTSTLELQPQLGIQKEQERTTFTLGGQLQIQQRWMVGLSLAQYDAATASGIVRTQVGYRINNRYTAVAGYNYQTLGTLGANALHTATVGLRFDW